jgi:hypothetical protein
MDPDLQHWKQYYNLNLSKDLFIAIKETSGVFVEALAIILEN